MNLKSTTLFAACILASISRLCADGFIVIPQPTEVPAGHYPFAPLQVTRHHVDVKISGQIATTTVDEEFFNPNNQRLEGTYLFPVPKNAHIDKFSMEVNGTMTEAELLPADKARKIYEDIVRQIRDPALLEYAGRDVFKARIFPIDPHSTKQVKIVYSELLKWDTGSLTYLYPLGTEKFSSQPIKDLSVRVDVTSDQPLASIYSPSHKVEIKHDGATHAIISYDSKNERPDTDFELVLTQNKDDAVGLNLLSYKDGDEDGYFLLLAAPSVAGKKDAKPAPKDVVFVLDTSGSMAGDKIEQAKKALAFCVNNLNDGDRFEIIRFSTDVDPLFSKLATADESNRKLALKFINRLKATGGTAIAEALKIALQAKPEKEDRPFVLIFLTDGMPTVGPTHDDDILAITKKAGGDTRIFSFGIGNDVNTQLLDQLAESTRAFSQYVRPEEDIEIKVSNFFARITEPVLTKPKLEISDSVRVSKMYPAALPDIFKGDQLVLAGRYTGSGDATAKLTGMVNGEEQTFTYKIHFDDQNAKDEFIPRLWATRRIGYLLDEIRMHGENPELRDEVVTVARQFGILTPYTSYLIIEDERRRNVPLAQQTRQDLGKDTDSLDKSREEYQKFQQEKSGSFGVANAQGENGYKYAAQPAADAAAANNTLLSVPMSGSTGVAGGSGAEQAETKSNQKILQYTQQSRYVNGRAFYQNGNQWIDARTQGLKKQENVQFNSDAYYSLLAKHPEAAQWLALGQNVQVALDDTIYNITN